jgi:hypothetical protein
MGGGWMNRLLGQALRRIASKKWRRIGLIFKKQFFGVDDPGAGELDGSNARAVAQPPL